MAIVNSRETIPISIQELAILRHSAKRAQTLQISCRIQQSTSALPTALLRSR